MFKYGYYKNAWVPRIHKGNIQEYLHVSVPMGKRNDPINQYDTVHEYNSIITGLLKKEKYLHV